MPGFFHLGREVKSATIRFAMAAKWTNSTVPTLAELRQHSAWFWVYCDKCSHRAPVAFVPLIIQWGADASSDKLRRSAKCSECGHKGATLQHPGWVDKVVGFQPFPTREVTS
jgi:hypothetical protein